MYFIYLFVFLICFTYTKAEGSCGDKWDTFHDDYYDICYKYIAGLHTSGVAYSGGANWCKEMENDSTLPTINTQKEQEFLNTILIKYKIVNNIWLDASIKGKHIVWTDRTSAEYENWIPGHPINDSNCVEMVTDESNVGQWLERPCSKNNDVICKRILPWSMQRRERMNRDYLRKVDRDNAKITRLELSQVPIGFMYVQLPGQAEPKFLWPDYTWSDVTMQYAGQFFRAEGNDSLGFGAGLQPGNAPRLTAIEYNYNKPFDNPTNIKPGEWSNFIPTGLDGQPVNLLFLRFLQTGGEVRPINQSVRIFKRIK